MVIQLSPQAEELLRQITADDQSRTADEVIEEALRSLGEQRRHERLSAAVHKGFASLDRGEGVSLTPELRAQLRQNARRKAADARWQPDSDRCP